MDASRFDRIAIGLARRLSRRAVLRASAAGFATTALGAPLGPTLAAQDVATPAATGEPAVSFLFVQIASSGSLLPRTGTPGAGSGQEFVLTLGGHAGNTVYFSDRPERLVGDAPTAHVFDLVFDPDDPPNAALVVDLPSQRGAVFVLELTNPSYDAESQTLTYAAAILQEYQGEVLTPVVSKGVVQAVDLEAGLTFGTSSLFIDAAALADCPDTTIHCCGGVYCDPLGHQQDVGSITVGTCVRSLCLDPCDGWDQVQSQCNQTYASACQAADRGYCEAACCGCPNCS
jgi:hypothetical protein